MKRKSPKETALMIRPASLPDKARALIQVLTPQEFIKERKGKGGKTFTYVEGGYVIAKLNQVFSPVGWDFEVVRHIIEPKEVVVKGKLTIKDHKNGYSISKTQYGTKERYAEVPLGDTLKAAATDCLKKCASMLGIALDVYWQQLDEDKLTSVKLGSKNGMVIMPPKVGNDKNKPKQPIATTINNSQMMKMSFDKIRNENDATILQQYRKRIMEVSVYNAKQKETLCAAIDRKLERYAGGN